MKKKMRFYDDYLQNCQKKCIFVAEIFNLQ